MFDFFVNLNPVVQALIATLFTWFVTLLGAALVYFFKNINKNIMDGMLGFSAGIMIAASFFSLLKPAGEMAENLEMIVWLVLVSGFMLGGILLFVGDKVFEHFYDRKKNSTSMKRILMLIFSITLHNIPSGKFCRPIPKASTRALPNVAPSRLYAIEPKATPTAKPSGIL